MLESEEEIARRVAESITPKPRHGEIEAETARIIERHQLRLLGNRDIKAAAAFAAGDIATAEAAVLAPSKIKASGGFRAQNPTEWLKAKKEGRRLTKLNKRKGRKTCKRRKSNPS